MDAYAARQLQKRKAEEEKEKKKQDEANRLHELQAKTQLVSLNRAFGLADPPKQVLALGKDQAAAVWWPYTTPSIIEPEIDEKSGKHKSPIPEPDVNYAFGWEVHRYRKDKSKLNGEWQYKGYTSFGILEKTQVVIDNLTNEFEYRFTVKLVNAKGPGTESTPSNPVMAEAPLPAGWYRFYDEEQQKHYYANIKLNKSTWTRPETDPYFLDETILLNFQDVEIEALQALFDEDMAHFKCVSFVQFMDILREIGERCRGGWIRQLFRGYAYNDDKLTTWTQFMTIMNHIKQHRIDQGEVLSRPFMNFLMYFRRRGMASMLQQKTCKMGDWRMEYSSLAGRYFYKNMVTNEMYWSMPAQVKFYIPPKLETKLLKVFDYGQIEEFQQYFSLLDIDNSGDLSGKEIRILLDALEIKINEVKFNKLIKTIDLNGNGKIEFDEYCWMMYEIYRKDKSAFFQDMQVKAKPKPTSKYAYKKRNDDDSLSIYNPANNSYNEGDLSIFNDAAFKNRFNFNTIKYTILGFRNNNSNSGSRSRILSMFKTLRRLGSNGSILSAHRRRSSTNSGNVNSNFHNYNDEYSQCSIDNQNNYQHHRPSISSLSTMTAATTQVIKRVTGMFTSPLILNTRKNSYTGNANNYENNSSQPQQQRMRSDSELNRMLSQFDDSKLLVESVAAIKKKRPSVIARQQQQQEGVYEEGSVADESFGYHGSFGKQCSVSTLGNPDHLYEDGDNDNNNDEEAADPTHAVANLMQRLQPKTHQALLQQTALQTPDVSVESPPPRRVFRVRHPPPGPPPETPRIPVVPVKTTFNVNVQKTVATFPSRLNNSPKPPNRPPPVEVVISQPAQRPSSPKNNRPQSPSIRTRKVSFSHVAETTGGSATNTPVQVVRKSLVFANMPSVVTTVPMEIPPLTGSPMQAVRRTSILKTESSIGNTGNTPTQTVRKSLVFAKTPTIMNADESSSNYVPQNVPRRSITKETSNSILTSNPSPLQGIRKSLLFTSMTNLAAMPSGTSVEYSGVTNGTDIPTTQSSSQSSLADGSGPVRRTSSITDVSPQSVSRKTNSLVMLTPQDHIQLQVLSQQQQQQQQVQAPSTPLGSATSTTRKTNSITMLSPTDQMQLQSLSGTAPPTLVGLSQSPENSSESPSGKLRKFGSSSNLKKNKSTVSPQLSALKRINSKKKIKPVSDDSSSDEELEYTPRMNKRKITLTSMVKSISRKFSTGGGGDDSDNSRSSSKGSGKGNAHSKHCMCGCRSY